MRDEISDLFFLALRQVILIDFLNELHQSLHILNQDILCFNFDLFGLKSIIDSLVLKHQIWNSCLRLTKISSLVVRT